MLIEPRGVLNTGLIPGSRQSEAHSYNANILPIVGFVTQLSADSVRAPNLGAKSRTFMD